MNLRTVKKVCYVLIGILLLLIILMGLTRLPLYGYIAIGLLVAHGVFTLIFWRCPHCGKSPGHLTAKFCPHCGGNLEDT